jgi:hypothetical protein
MKDFRFAICDFRLHLAGSENRKSKMFTLPALAVACFAPPSYRLPAPAGTDKGAF